MTNIYQLFEEDHTSIKDLSELLSLTNEHELNKRILLFDELTKRLRIHSSLEEIFFYNELEKIDNNTIEEINFAKKEHEAIEKQFEKLDDIEKSDPSWLNLFNNIRHSLIAHFKKEEAILFKMAQALFSQEKLEDIYIKVRNIRDSSIENLILVKDKIREITKNDEKNVPSYSEENLYDLQVKGF
jgi:hypothetical protein